MSIDQDTLKYLDEFYGEVDVQLSLLGVEQSNCGELLKSGIIEYSLKEDWENCCIFEDIVEKLDGTPTKVELYLELLNIQGHGLHQVILRFIQDNKYEPAIPHIDAMLSNGLSEFEHRTSEPDAIASWVSWALAGIGTSEAISIIDKYSKSDDPIICKEMTYRLERVRERNAK